MVQPKRSHMGRDRCALRSELLQWQESLSSLPYATGGIVRALRSSLDYIIITVISDSHAGHEAGQPLSLFGRCFSHLAIIVLIILEMTTTMVIMINDSIMRICCQGIHLHKELIRNMRTNPSQLVG